MNTTWPHFLYETGEFYGSEVFYMDLADAEACTAELNAPILANPWQYENDTILTVEEHCEEWILHATKGDDSAIYENGRLGFIRISEEGSQPFNLVERLSDEEVKEDLANGYQIYSEPIYLTKSRWHYGPCVLDIQSNPKIIKMFDVPKDMTITPEQLLESTDIGCGFHLWCCEGGVIRISREELEPILRDAYDPAFPSWPSLISISWDEWEGWHVA